MINSTIISKGEPVPCEITKLFFVTTLDLQSEAVPLKVTQSTVEETDPEEVHTVWEGTLELDPEKTKKDDPITATFSYTAGELMKCVWVHVPSGATREIGMNESVTDQDTSI